MTVEIGKGSFPSRSDFISLGVGLFVVGSVPLAVRGRRRQLVRRTLPLMGTLGEVDVVHGDERYAQGGIDAGMRIALLQTVTPTLDLDPDRWDVYVIRATVADDGNSFVTDTWSFFWPR